jgi:hypothetical protein
MNNWTKILLFQIQLVPLRQGRANRTPPPQQPTTLRSGKRSPARRGGAVQGGSLFTHSLNALLPVFNP